MQKYIVNYDDFVMANVVPFSFTTFTHQYALFQLTTVSVNTNPIFHCRLTIDPEIMKHCYFSYIEN